MNFISEDPLTLQLTTINIHDWSSLVQFIQQLPYGRTANRTDLSLVISEQKGTCSSKHALLKRVAELNNIPDIQLVIGIYKMSEANTPGIGKALSNNGLTYIPEAHCYLKVKGVQTDYTATDASFQKIQNDILEEIDIQPHQIAEYKVAYHKAYLKNWLKTNATNKTFDELWAIREACIHNLSIS